jgi:death-on-curing protein
MYEPSVVDAVRLHDRIIEVTGGLPGVRDKGLLESAINKPSTHLFGRERYKSHPSKAAALLEGIALYHPFADGNKRTAMAMADLYLFFNNIKIEYTNEEYEVFMISVVNKKLTVRQIADWLKKHQII